MADIRAPDFPADATWLNTDRPLSLAGELRGRVVLLDFWTYCCANCMHVLPDLEYLEEKFRGEPVVVVGVHSNKFTQEGAVEAVRAAVERYGVRHPVVVDTGHRIWSSYAVTGWPTLVLIGPEGRIVGQVSGEGHRALLEKAIAGTLARGRAAGNLASGPLRFPEEAPARRSPLSFPAKVLVDGVNRRLVIVDSNHHRLLLTSWPDEEHRVRVLEKIGSGERGGDDGPAHAARFHRPQGAVLAGAENQLIYVADTENHLLRRVDLQRHTVTTILGTGEQTFEPEGGKSGREQPLNSPWDVAVFKNRLYVSNAGQHQIFVMNLMTGMTEIAAGSARENIRDGEALEANLAQPSGLALDPAAQRLYFADSETSAVRYLDLQQKQVHTLVGQDLFDFGDIDGDRETARLQHPLGVALGADGRLLVADTYNHKIRQIDLQTGSVSTVLGGEKGLRMFEPAGVVPFGEEEALIADTNQHRLVRANLRTGAWSEVRVVEG